MNVTEIFLDTSIIKIKNVEDYSNIIFGKNYSDFVDFINSNGISDTCKINVAEIVVEEFKKQACDSFAEDETDLKKMMNHPFTGVSSFYEINMKFQISFRKINVKYFYFPIDCFSHCRFHSTHSPRRSSPAILYRLPFSGLSAQIPESSVLLLLSARRPPARHDHTGTLFPALHRFPFFLRDFPHR